MRETFSSPFAVEREGDASARAGSVCPVCQPLFVLPPLFDSNLVELLYIQESIMTVFLSAVCCTPIPSRLPKQYDPSALFR